MTRPKWPRHCHNPQRRRRMTPSCAPRLRRPSRSTTSRTWPSGHTSTLEEEARRACGDTDAWAFLAMARRQEEAMRQGAFREEEEHHVHLKHEAELQAAARSNGRRRWHGWHAYAGRLALRTRGRPGNEPSGRCARNTRCAPASRRVLLGLGGTPAATVSTPNPS
jgi:hypothetical protein